MAVNANATRIVWAPKGVGVYYSSNGGGAWTASTGVPAEAKVVSDRVNPNKFYAFANGAFYVSANGGASFSATVTTGLPSQTSIGNIKAVPGREGDVWLAAAPGGIAFTASGIRPTPGSTFTKLANVQEADNVGFGKAAPGQSYLAIYVPARVGGVRGIYRSDDGGATWLRINDDQHQWGVAGSAAITGDPRIYGRVYLSTNGRGVIYGDPSGGGCASSASLSTQSW